jgi:hypothetical protein
MSDKNIDNRRANNILYISAVVGIIPLLAIYFLYIYNPQSPLWYSVFNSMQDIPSITSDFNPLMTKAMDLYCKSAPLLAIFFFLVQLRYRKIDKITDRKKILQACVLSPFFYALYAYLVLWGNLELTIAGRPARYLSENNFTLLIFYSLLYIATQFMTFGICSCPLLAHKLWKER